MAMSDGRGKLGGLNAYSAMVSDFHAIGYVCKTFDNFSPAQRHLILRHDVDVNLDAAVTMARLEQANGWQSTFFVLVNGGAYDAASMHGRRALCAIADLGHEVGLHFDPAVYDETVDMDTMVAGECAVLERLLGKAVSVIAPHQPRKTCPDWLGMARAPAGKIQAYHPRYFLDAAYVSDSVGTWFYGHPLDHPKVRDGLGIQILTHPELWVAS